MAILNIKFNNKNYSIDSAAFSGATAALEAHLVDMMEERLEGDSAEYYTLAPTALSFRSTAPLNEFQEVQINGVTVDSSNYTLEEGSTVVTFHIDYLKTLNVGNYEVAVASNSKTVKGEFSVKAPELNEHDFYYNQPYTAFVASFNENESFFIRDDGTMDIIGTPSGTISAATYSVSGNNITVVSEVAGTLTGTISADGTEIYCNELGTSFALGDSSILADNEYIYVYSDALAGYTASAIDKSKTFYKKILSNIEGIPVTTLANEAFIDSNIVMTSSVIGDNIRYIGERAFSRSQLRSVKLSSNIEEIGQGAFSECNNLLSVDIADTNISALASQTFDDCFGLTQITIPKSVTYIGMFAFFNCVNLGTVKFNGTISEWNGIHKASDWNYNVPATHVQCTDGTVAL